MAYPEDVKFATAQGEGFVLQSAREAVAFRIESVGQDGSDLYQATRTVAIYGMLDGKQGSTYKLREQVSKIIETVLKEA